jgi:hypothetical protein
MKIKPKILQIVDAGKKKQAIKDAEAELVEAEISRQKSLREFYEDLVDYLEDGQFAPLFEDFLQFGSVQALWVRRDDQDLRETVNSLNWSKQEESILADCQEHHLDVIENAVRLILSTTEQFSDEHELDREVEKTMEGDLDSFFKRATSIMFCDAGCEVNEIRRRTSYWPRVHVVVKKRKGTAFFGPLSQIVAHQHKVHNDFVPSKPKIGQRKKQGLAPSFRFILPLEVASLVSDFADILEHSIHQIKEATVEDLKLLGDSNLCCSSPEYQKTKRTNWSTLASYFSPFDS